MLRCFEESEPTRHQLRSFIYAVDDYFSKLQHVLMASLSIKFHSQLHLYETLSILFHQTNSQVLALRIGSAHAAANAAPTSSPRRRPNRLI